MKIKYNWIAGIALFGSLAFINYKLISVGVNDAVVIIFSFLYGLVFPWKFASVEVIDNVNNKEGDDTDASTK